MNNPEDPSAGTRKVPFSGELYIEQDDFREVPPPKYYRLYPGNQVRLRYGYIVTCTGREEEPVHGRGGEVLCTYDPPPGGQRAGQPQGEGDHPLGVGRPLPARGGPPVRSPVHSPSTPRKCPPGVDWKDTINPASLEVVRAPGWSRPGGGARGQVPVRTAWLFLR